MSRILALHDSHNASICEINNNEIIYYQEAERINKEKKTKNWTVLFEKYKDENFDKIKKIMERAVVLEVPNKVDYESGPNWGEIK